MTVAGVEALGLRVGDRVRFKPFAGRSRQWSEGVVVGLEKDGSVAVRDTGGAWHALRPERLEARRSRRRGQRSEGVRWEPVAERAARTEQLPLW